MRVAAPFAAVVVAATVLAGCGQLPPGGSSGGAASTPFLGVMNDASHGWEMTGGGVARTSDAGRTWTELKGLPAINYAWGTVASFTSADVAWLCEQGRARGSQPGVSGDTRTFATPTALCVVTADGGATWTKHDVPGSGTSGFGRRRDDATVDDLLGLSGREAWLTVGTVDTFAGGGQESIGLIELALRHTVDAGAHWVAVRDLKVDINTPWPGGALDWVDVGPSGAIYVSGFSKGIDRSTDGGATWTTLNAPLPLLGQAGTQVFCGLAEQGDQLTVTFRESVNNNQKIFSETSTDAGKTWSAAVQSPATPSGGMGFGQC
jgi:hypothetical protein